MCGALGWDKQHLSDLHPPSKLSSGKLILNLPGEAGGRPEATRELALPPARPPARPADSLYRRRYKIQSSRHGFRWTIYTVSDGPCLHVLVAGVPVSALGATVRPAALQSGWLAYGHGYEAPSTTKYGDLCVVSGLIKKSGSMAKLLMTLPSDCRPNKRVIFNLNNHQNPLRVDVNTNGQVQYVAGTWQHGWISLDGIQFATRNQKALAVHNGWTYIVMASTVMAYMAMVNTAYMAMTYMYSHGTYSYGTYSYGTYSYGPI